MANVLLDTNAIVFFNEGSDQLTEGAYELLLAPESRIYFSAVSYAELACAQERKRLELPGHWKEWLTQVQKENGWSCLDISARIIQEAYSLPDLSHRDPADRILIATARIHQLTVITTDRVILTYPHVASLS